MSEQTEQSDTTSSSGTLSKKRQKRQKKEHSVLRTMEYLTKKSVEMFSSQESLSDSIRDIIQMFGQTDECRFCYRTAGGSEHNLKEVDGHKFVPKIHINFRFTATKPFLSRDAKYGEDVYYLGFRLSDPKYHSNEYKLQVLKDNDYYENPEEEYYPYNDYDLLKSMVMNDAIPIFLDELRTELDKRNEQYKMAAFTAGKLVTEYSK